MAAPTPATYINVRRHLGKKFTISITSTGRRSGQRWSEGAQVRISHIYGVVVDYVESHAAYDSDDSVRRAVLVEMRAYLSEKFDVTDFPLDNGRLIVNTKQQ